MTADAMSPKAVPLSHLSAEEKALRAATFGTVASHYERFRPGPPLDAVEWVLGNRHGYVIDLGAGTGALTRLLVGRCEPVVAIEPDDRMRSVLSEEVPQARALKGQGESMPVEDGVAQAVLASSSWHWIDPIPTLHEVGRVLEPGGVLGAIWSGPDPEGAFLVQARALIEQQSAIGPDVDADSESSSGGGLAGLIMTDADRPNSTLEIPVGVGFSQPETASFSWDIALTADDLVGLLGTFSWFLTMPGDAQQGVVLEARRLLRDFLGVEGEVTIDVGFRCEGWRSYRDS